MNNLPNEVFTSNQVKLIERDHANNHNGHCFDLMQSAGQAVFDYIVQNRPETREIFIFCGKGNNGGDGYIVANLMLQHNINHRVFATGVPHEGSEASIAYEYYLKQGGKVEYELPNSGSMQSSGIISYTLPDVVVDALLGTGIESAPAGTTAKWIGYINRLKAFTVAVDVPSGLVSDTGNVPGLCVDADVTVCMLALKPGLFTSYGVDFVGKVVFAPLGIDSRSYHSLLQESSYCPLPIDLIGYEDVRFLLTRRLPSCNKSDNGKVLIISGSKGMGGAAIICGSGALRTGSGLVKVATDENNVCPMLCVRPELMSVDLSDPAELNKAIVWADAVAAGPGLGVNDDTAFIVNTLDNLKETPVVLDADALTVLSHFEEGFYNDNRILTPHPGEASRLLHVPVEDINSNRLISCYKLQQRYGGVILLKGAGTVICDGQRIAIIKEGSPALATGGSGDLLTGIIVSLLGQGLSLYDAAVTGACIHGRAGFLSGEDGGITGSLPSDVLKYVRVLVNANS
ncbi:MAG: NAD(P)H-hydrate dehydratase [Succinivibrio sp.]|jgi:NAD(P)H-hydrate epimerase|nr:NAD(P)H-hydrate dehydratase [Succinivibrio sp.]